jgi:ClpP class serine protease
MYIACSSDKIFSGPSGIIGSVGVRIGPFFNVFETLTKIGMQAKTITEGLDKDMLNPTRPWKEGEDASLKAVTSFFYHHFVDIVASQRPNLDKTKLIEVYGAQIYDPVTAQAYGYIDVANATRDQALLELVQAAHMDPTKTYEVIELEPKNAWISALLSKSPLITGKIEHTFDVGAPKIKGQLAYLYDPLEN